MEESFPADFFLFRGLREEEWRPLLTAGTRESFGRGEVIYSSQRFRCAIGVVLTGQVLVTRDAVVLNRLGPGEVFGVAALYGGETAYVTQVCAATACTVRFFPQERIDRWLRQDFRMAENYIRFLSGRIRFLNGRIAAFTGGAAENRLLTYLRQHADEDGLITLPLTMTDLSRALDIGRSSLYRSLDLLEQSGEIRREGKQLYYLYKEKGETTV